MKKPYRDMGVKNTMNEEHRLLCKAKDEKNNKWVYGFFVRLREYTPSPIGDKLDKPIPYKCYIARERTIDWNLPTELELIPIKEDTLCQYTGYKDAYGKQLFEHDTIEYKEHIYEVQLAYTLNEKEIDVLSNMGNFSADLKLIGNCFDDLEKKTKSASSNNDKKNLTIMNLSEIYKFYAIPPLAMLSNCEYENLYRLGINYGSDDCEAINAVEATSCKYCPKGQPIHEYYPEIPEEVINNILLELIHTARDKEILTTLPNSHDYIEKGGIELVLSALVELSRKDEHINQLVKDTLQRYINKRGWDIRKS